MKSCLFIDGGYMEKIIHGRMDYKRLPEVLLKAAGGGHLLRTYYYDCVPEDVDTGRRRFLDALAYIPNFVVRYGYLDRYVDGKGNEVLTQKMTDVQIALDIVKAAQRGVERIILVTGDMDLVPAMEAAREMFCEVVLVYHNGSQQLFAACDRKVVFGAALQEECRWKQE